MFALIFDTENEKQMAVRLYEKYSNFIFRSAYSILGDTNSAEDAAQQAFIKVAENLDKIDEADEVKTRNYIGTITRNTARKMYNHLKKQPLITEITFGHNNVRDISELIITKETCDRIQKHILELEPPYREIIFLRLDSGLEYSQIARLLNITPETARKRFERARKQILKLLLEEDNKNA